MSPGDRFVRYLTAKRGVDDRALDRRVWERLHGEIAARAAARRDGTPFRVLEVGAGNGAMVERLLAAGLPDGTRLTAVDADRRVAEDGARRLPEWARRVGFAVEGGAERLRLARDGRAAEVEWVVADALEWCGGRVASGGGEGEPCDLLVACALVDLLDLPTALPRLLGAVAPGGLAWFPISFDGGTWFEPPGEDGEDELVARLYHRTIDRRRGADGSPAGSSASGRRLLSLLPELGAEVLAAGASDWVVHPGRDGYPGDEAFFLGFLVDTVAGALEGERELAPARIAAWRERRHLEIAERRLVLVVHQLDVLARVPPAP